MTSPADDTAIAAEFDILAGKLGIEVPPELKGGVLRGYRGLRDMTVLLRGVCIRPAPDTTEPTEPPGD